MLKLRSNLLQIVLQIIETLVGNLKLNVRKRKVIKVPCKAIADSISGQLLNDDAVIDVTSFIQKLEKLKQKNKRKLWKVIRPKAFRNDSLKKLLIKLQSPQELEVTLNQYWRNFWEETEQERYSEFSVRTKNF